MKCLMLYHYVYIKPTTATSMKTRVSEAMLNSGWTNVQTSRAFQRLVAGMALFDLRAVISHFQNERASSEQHQLSFPLPFLLETGVVVWRGFSHLLPLLRVSWIHRGPDVNMRSVLGFFLLFFIRFSNALIT